MMIALEVTITDVFLQESESESTPDWKEPLLEVTKQKVFNNTSVIQQ